MRSDLILARREPEPGVLLESLCFHAQQATGKGLKAVLTHFGVPFPKTHNLTVLVESLPPECPRPPDVEGVKELSAYAVNARYPAGWGELTEDDYRESVDLADGLLAWAQSIIRGNGAAST